MTGRPEYDPAYEWLKLTGKPMPMKKVPAKAQVPSILTWKGISLIIGVILLVTLLLFGVWGVIFLVVIALGIALEFVYSYFSGPKLQRSYRRW